MKKAFLFIFGLMSTVLLAQKTEITLKQDFHEIKLYDKIHATLIKSDINKVVVNGVNEDEVSAKVDEGILRVKSSVEDIWDDSQTSVKIYCTAFTSLDVNEGSSLQVNDKIDQKNLNLSAQEGASIKAAVNLKTLTVKIYSGGKIALTGKATHQSVKIRAGGNYDGKSLTTESTTVNVAAGGFASVKATASCTATTKAGGKIVVYGDPEQLKRKTVLGGDIEKK